jgi:hypothetical protein
LVHERLSKQVLFASRDGNLWVALWQALYPDVPAAYFFCSRASYLAASDGFRRYAELALSVPSVLVDLAGSGITPSAFFSSLPVRPLLYFVIDMSTQRFLDPFAVQFSRAGREMPKRIEAISVATFDDAFSVSGTYDSSLIEAINYAKHGSVLDVAHIPEIGKFFPRFDEYEQHHLPYIDALQSGFRACLEAIRGCDLHAEQNPDSWRELVLGLLRRICSDGLLSSLFLEEHYRKNDAWVRFLNSNRP